MKAVVWKTSEFLAADSGQFLHGLARIPFSVVPTLRARLLGHSWFGFALLYLTVYLAYLTSHINRRDEEVPMPPRGAHQYQCKYISLAPSIATIELTGAFM